MISASSGEFFNGYYLWTKKTISGQPKNVHLKTKPRSKPLPKAKEKYLLEAEETLFQELEEHVIGYDRKFQFESTKNWRFDFYIVRLRLLIEIAGSPWSVGRGRRKIANSFNKYDLAEERGYTFVSFELHQKFAG